MKISPHICTARSGIMGSFAIIVFCAYILNDAFTEEYLFTEPGTGQQTLNAHIKGVPGGVFYDAFDVLAEVTAIDRETREVTLLSETGESLTMVFDPGGINFDELKVGDQVRARATQRVVVFVGDANAAEDDVTVAAIAGTPKGEKPGLIGAESIRLTATLVGIDLEQRTVTVEFPDGSVKSRKVRDDIKLEEHQIGEKIVYQLDAGVSVEVVGAPE